MTCRNLFLKRLIDDFRFQWSLIFHLVGNPIMFFYSIGLVSFFGAFAIKDIWDNTAEYWSAEYPFAGLLAILLVLASTGNFRTFLFEADLLYFIQTKKTMSNLRLFGFLTSSIKGFLQVIVLLALALPVLLFSYQFDFQELLMLLIMINAYKLLLMTNRKMLGNQIIKWFFSVLIFLGVLLFIIWMPPIFWGILGLLLIFGVIMIQFYVSKNNRHFYREIEIDFLDRHKYLRLMILMSMFDKDAPIKIEKTSDFQKKKPRFLFKNSKRIFKVRSKENGLLEFCLKAFLRNKGDRSVYFRVMMIPTAIVTFLPLWWFKIIVYICFIFVIRSYMKGIYFKITKHSFFHVVLIEEDTIYLTLNRFLLWTTLPTIILTGITWFLPLLLIG